MRGILDQRERMNLPAGMSELDLINYSPVLYELYRNEGQGFDNDAFRYDPVVSTGMLASDYELAKGLAWVNYLTPESQGAINPGDNLIVPVQTFDNYKNLPPWEKKLSHEVSYTGKNVESKYSANLLNLQASQVGMKNNFVGDFSYYFDKESRLLGLDRDRVALSALEAPATPIEQPTTVSSYPRPKIMVASTPRPISPIIETTAIPVKPRVTSILTTQVSNVPGLVATNTNTTPTNSSSPTGEIINGGYLPSTGGGAVMSGGAMSGGDTGGGAMMSGGGEEMPEGSPEATQENTTSTAGGGDAKKIAQECKINYIPVIIGLIVLAIIGYAIAKQKKKDIKTFSIVGAIIGSILGYAYSVHQCKPIEALSKVGIKSKSESNYYGGR